MKNIEIIRGLLLGIVPFDISYLEFVSQKMRFDTHFFAKSKKCDNFWVNTELGLDKYLHLCFPSLRSMC